MSRATRSKKPSAESALEEWLRTKGVARYDAYKRDLRGRPAEKVFARLRRHHVKRLSKPV
jgi:hypothetical protein